MLSSTIPIDCNHLTYDAAEHLAISAIAMNRLGWLDRTDVMASDCQVTGCIYQLPAYGRVFNTSR
jgi:hypothetical protein